MPRLVLASLCVIGIFVSAPAEARTWIRVGDGWVDRDSIRRAGQTVFFDYGQGGTGDGQVLPVAYNCATRFFGAVMPDGSIGLGQRLDGERAAAFFTLLCR